MNRMINALLLLLALAGARTALGAEIIVFEQEGFRGREAKLGGECRTFGPGDYPASPWGINHRISSGRRISRHYPYSQNPNWPR